MKRAPFRLFTVEARLGESPPRALRLSVRTIPATWSSRVPQILRPQKWAVLSCGAKVSGKSSNHLACLLLRSIRIGFYGNHSRRRNLIFPPRKLSPPSRPCAWSPSRSATAHALCHKGYSARWSNLARARHRRAWSADPTATTGNPHVGTKRHTSSRKINELGVNLPPVTPSPSAMFSLSNAPCLPLGQADIACGAATVSLRRWCV